MDHHIIPSILSKLLLSPSILSLFLYALYHSFSEGSKPVHFGAQTGRWGDERVVTAVSEWGMHEDEGIALIERCDALLKSLKNDAFGSARWVEVYLGY